MVAAAGSLVGIHATDPASVYLGALARVDGFTRERMAAALYDDRTLLKVLGMRRTMFVVPRDLAGVIQAAVTDGLAGAERRRLVGMLRDAGVATDAEAWLADAEEQTMRVLGELGEATATELSRRVPALRVQIPFGEGRKWAGQVGVSTRLLFLLATEGRLVRGRPRGSWLSSMYAWAPMAAWLGAEMARLPLEEAQSQLAQRYLAAYGPATERDVRWWTGWTLTTARKALSACAAQEVQLEDGRGFVSASDMQATPEPDTWMALLPALDTTTMGWADRAWYLGDYGARLFDRSGNAGPTVWLDGRVVGGWAQRVGGEVVYRLLEDVGRENERRVAAEAARIAEWLGGSRITPRFRTPLERELSA